MINIFISNTDSIKSTNLVELISKFLSKIFFSWILLFDSFNAFYKNYSNKVENQNQEKLESY